MNMGLMSNDYKIDFIINKQCRNGRYILYILYVLRQVKQCLSGFSRVDNLFDIFFLSVDKLILLNL